MATIKENIVEYIMKTYDVISERPWMDSPENITFKERYSGKWFAIIMFVKKSSIRSVPEIEKDDREYVLNVKVDPEIIPFISSQNGILPAYHMNKRNWISILLDESVPYSQICQLIADSYSMIVNTPTRRIYEAVKTIPYGKVATYAQVAEMAGDRKMARAVGNALHKNPDPDNIPCFRVVNSKGELAGAFAFGGAGEQAKMLNKEGVKVINDKVDISVYGI